MARVRTGEQQAETLQTLKDENERLKLALKNQESALEAMKNTHLGQIQRRMKRIDLLTIEQITWLIDDMYTTAPIYLQLSNYGRLGRNWQEALGKASQLLRDELLRRKAQQANSEHPAE